MRVDWALVTAPTEEPLEVSEADLEARIDVTDEDPAMASYLSASREDAEEYLSRGLLTQTWRLTQDGFTDDMWLPRAAPLQAVSAVEYYNAAGTLQTVPTSVYDTLTDSEPARVVLKPNQQWPVVQANRVGAVRITYVVGWADPVDIPKSIVQGIRVLLTARAERLVGKDWDDAWQTATACWSKWRVWWQPPCEAS